jgi:hypothetical protein
MRLCRARRRRPRTLICGWCGRPDGTPAPDGPLVNDVDVTTVPLDGIEPSHVVLATRAGDRGRLVAAFRRCAQDCLTAAAAGLGPVAAGLGPVAAGLGPAGGQVLRPG